MFKISDHDDPIDRSKLVEPTLDKPAESSRSEFQTRSVSYIGPSLEFTGDLLVSEALIVEGHILGSVTSKDRRLTVGKKGRIEGEVHGHEVDVRGRVDGDVSGQFPALGVDEGAEMNGVIDMKIDRKRLAKKVIKSVDGKNDGVARMGS